MRKLSMQKKLIIGIFIGCLIPYLIGGLYLNSFVKKGLFNNRIHNTNQILTQVNELIENSFIRNIKEEVNMLSLLNFVKESKGTLNNYSNYENIDFLYRKRGNEETINEHFKLFKDTHSYVNFAFLATSDGGYTEYPTFLPTENYFPTARPWYESTIGKSQVQLSEPYITKMTNEIIISFSKSVLNKKEHIGVIGIAVSIDDLSNNISSINIGESGYLIVLSKENKFIVSPKDPNWILKTPEELHLTPLLDVDLESVNYFEGKIDSVEKIFTVFKSESSGWKIIAVQNKSEILENLNEVTNILTAIYVITSMIIFVIVYTISSEITKPLFAITQMMKSMSKFDFSKRIKVESYTECREIDTISSALDEMHTSFSEFMNQLSLVDNEIKHVDIEKNTTFRLELSDDNPLNKISSSINSLLEKIYASFEELKASNRIVHENNELLSSSEEELLSQLDEIEKQREYINFLALHDPLTNLPNRRNFIEVLNNRLNSHKSGAVVLLDLDNFKAINDTLGHVFGDKVLQSIADRLESISHDNIFVSRFGGDEFLILIDDSENNDIDYYVSTIYELFKEKFNVDNNDIEINSSMGITIFPDDSLNVNQLIMNSDLALYTVKNLSKNGYKYFDETMKEHLLKRSYIEVILKDALENDGFKLVYQPQVSLKNGSIYGYEALIRLTKHNVSPADFINIAEESGLIIPIGRIVTRDAILQLNNWKKNNIELKPIAINFSAHQLHDNQYINFLSNLLKDYDIEPKYIEIEITESIFLENKNATLSFLKELRNMGVKIAIDDFGTGYSSLSYLTFLPVDKIKLDKSLNDRFLELDNIKVMDSLISLAHSLNLCVVAEGIELIDQVNKLKIGRCDYIQGYYFSRPIESNFITQDFTSQLYNI